ncbi:hypothetical protein OBV_p-00570 (plasmid) [Oscillibacter valericigenes Sjm18-20]|nr:hypothetical protein OBV_p-00570 [Oscillibacter valericigenes Sjm18-20]
MENKEYLLKAVDLVIDYAAENGVKYRRGDFSLFMRRYNDDGILNFAGLVGEKENPEGVKVQLFFAFPRCGSRLKSRKDAFLNYFNARAMSDCVMFTFSLNELDIQSAGETDADASKIDEVIRKVQKLLAKADPEKNPSEQEAIAASLMAQKLLAKYNIDIQAVTGKEKKEDIEQIIADVGTGKKWKYGLAETVARSYCCKCFYFGSDAIVFYGYRSDTLIARRVFAYLFNVGNKLAARYVKENREDRWAGGDGLYNSFCSGFIAGVDKELSTNCTALALVVPEEVKTSFDAFTESFKAIDHSIKTSDRKAWKEGFTEGERALTARYLEKDRASS